MARYRPTVADAIVMFEHDADPELVTKARRLVATGDAEWVRDPEVEGTFALVREGNWDRALVLVYAPQPDVGETRWDFEVGEDMYR